jgi:DNA-binding SARP family transcriptional activator
VVPDAVERIVGARRRRCLLVVGAAGYGKTSALRTALHGHDTYWLAHPDVTALEQAAHDHEWVVVDDLPDLPEDAANRLVTAAVHVPEPASVALVSRRPLCAQVSRWRGRGVLAELGPADLALPVDRVDELLTSEYGVREPGVARRVHEATGGWPALVRLAGEALADGATLSGLAQPGTALAAYVADEVLGGLPTDVRRLLASLGDLAPLEPALCRTLGHPGADSALRLLAAMGVANLGRVVPVVAEVARHGRRRAANPDRDRTAAAWYATHGPPIAEARAHLRRGDHDGYARVLAAHGDAIVAAGEAAAVADMVAALPARLVDRRMRLLFGDALRTVGDSAAAMDVLAPLAGERVLGADVAWRLGAVHHQMGDPVAALAVYARADANRGTAVDRVHLHALTATAHWILGAVDDGLACAGRAVDVAVAGGEPRALASAYVAYALCLSLVGDPAAAGEHYEHAARLAEDAGDVVQAVRIDLNRSHHQLAEGLFADAARSAGRAARRAERSAPPLLLSVALCNQGEALTRLADYDVAARCFDRARLVARQVGPSRTVGALTGLAEVHRRRGEYEQARGAYEEAVRIIRECPDRQNAVPALAGLARLIVREDPEQATVLAKEALDAAAGSGLVPALLAAGHAAVARGDATPAGKLANRAVERARQRRERAWLAEALELRADAETDPARQRAALVEAHEIWRAGGARDDTDRVLVALGRLTNADPDTRLHGRLAAERLTAAGVVDASVGMPGQDQPSGYGLGAPRVVIRTLGRFEVFVDGRAVAASAWQSRKARDLLRILVARRGQAVPRLELSELLWPDDDPIRTAHRLSVLLSIVRTVAGPRILVADAASVALDLSQIRVDVEELLGDVGHGARLRQRGALAEAQLLLADVVRGYEGEPFADDPYADWAGPLREEARGAYLRAVRLLADLAATAGDHDGAATHLARLIEQDPYDETAHRGLVAVLRRGGRHGEARRAFRRYRAAMVAIGVRPPDRAILSHDGAGARSK